MIASIFFIDLSSLSQPRHRSRRAQHNPCQGGSAMVKIPVCAALRLFAYVFSKNTPNFWAAFRPSRPVQELADPLDRLANCVTARRVGESQIALAVMAKAGASDRRHPRLIEQLSLQGAGIKAGT